MNVKHVRWQLIASLGLSLFLVLTTPAFSQQGVNLEFNSFSYDDFPALGATITVINDSGIPYQKLEPNAFQASEDGKRVDIKSVTEKVNPEVTIAVVLAIDGSGSMGANNFTPWNQAKESAISFLQSLGANDQAALVVFGDAVDTNEPVRDHLDPIKEAYFTTDKQALIDQIQNLPEPVVNVTTTPLYDAAYKSVLMAADLKGAAGKRAVILFTDGKEGNASGAPVSKLSQDAAISEAQNKHIPVFSIRLGDLPDVDYLQRLANRTGGDFLEAPAAADLAGIYQDISDRLKTQYDLTFTSHIRCDNNEHGLEIKAQTEDGETVNTETFTAFCPIKPGLQLFYAKPSEITGGQPSQELLEKGFEVPQTEEHKLFNIIPVISARHPIQRVEYFVDDAVTPSFVATNPPFSYLWDTTLVLPAEHSIRVVAYDNQPPPNVGETNVTVTAGWVIQETDPLWIWAIVVVLLIILLVAIALILRHRRSPDVEQIGPGGEYAPGPGPVNDPVAPLGPGPFSGFPVDPTIGPVTAQPGGSDPLTTAGDFGVSSAQGFGGMLPGTAVVGGTSLGATAFLVMEQGNRPGQQYPLAEQNTIGRDGSQCNVVIDDGSVSRCHARIKQQGSNVYYIYDLASTNPIRVNGEITSGLKLEDGDKIELGRVRLVFKQVK